MGRGDGMVVGRVVGDAVGSTDRVAGNAIIPYPGKLYGVRWRRKVVAAGLQGHQAGGEGCQLLCDFYQGLGSGVSRR